MHFAWVGLMIATASALAQAPSSPREDAAGLTADELMLQADSAYNARNYPEAAKLYRRFIEDFGKSAEPQIQEVIRRRRFPLAMCYIHSKNFEEASTAIAEALALQPPLAQQEVQQLLFWQGVSAFQRKDYAEARQGLEKFLGAFQPGIERLPHLQKQFPASAYIPEARLLIGATLLLEDKYQEAADYLGGILPALPREERGRAVILRLYALQAAGDLDASLALIREEFPRLGDITQVAAFHALALQTGSQLLEAGRLRDAIACLQRVWPRERTLRHQQMRLADIEARLAALEANPTANPYDKLNLSQQAAKIRREIETFSKIENFDSALRLRLASAYLAMQRHREAALIMEEMLEKMEPDAVVHQASLSLVQCWNKIERWPKVIEAAVAFEETFPKSEHLPTVLFLRGIAEQQSQRLPEAVATFDRLAKGFPKHELGPRGHFLRAFTRLLAEDNKAAIEDFRAFLKAHSKHELADAAHYWLGMAHSLDKQFAEAREIFSDYLESRKDGAFRESAHFRRAYCAQQLEDFNTSIRELYEHIRQYPGGEHNAEARVLLGDALMNEGRMEEGLAAFAGIPREAVRFYEEGVFKSAKALKLMEEYDRLRALMEKFIEENPRSPRVAEAVFQLGWYYRQAGEPERARQIYWEAIEKYGPDPEIRSVEDLFPALARFYRGEEEQAQYLARLRDLREEADAANQPALALRALWAQAHALRRQEPERARSLLLQAAERVNVQTTNPLILADVASALEESGDMDKAETLWRDLIKWNPRAPQKDRALAALGMLEMRRGNEKAALAHFDRFERETFGSALLPQVMLARAKLQEERGQFAAARASLETLLQSPAATGPQKCEALYRIGEIYLREGKPGLAIPYFQRIYVMHGKWRDWVARAYFRSGEAFEKLKDTLSARRTYQELSGREDLADFAESQKARERLEALGGPLPATTPAAG